MQLRIKSLAQALKRSYALAFQQPQQFTVNGLQALGDGVPLNEKARAEQLIAEIRELVKNNSSDVARLRQLAGDLQQVAHGLASAAAGGQTGSSGAQPGGPGGARPGGGDDVIDAEFKET